ncbi:glycosyltransferase [Ruminiclostridium cellobioparum]|uniref:glycosyltransferase n=1 Tax=Ruminiclostridium cellobioparum TaxID=29355 RepID=UPI0006879CE9|nr:glycosyltransferase [Ruminiclostridium cellobioparum]
MNKIIVLPGTADATFFINEVNYITKYFDEVVVISYPGNEEVFSNLAKEKGFRYYVVKANILKALISFGIFKWLFDKNTRKEIKSVFSISKLGLSKIIYILHYGLFYINAKRYIDREISRNLNDNVYMYSFWLTRGAYAIANYNVTRKSNLKKIVSRAHGYDLYEERNLTRYLPFRDFIDINLDEIHFISGHGLNYFTQRYISTTLSSIKNISRLGTYNPYEKRKKIIEKDKVCIASCSSIIPVKRLDLIIDIIANIDLPVTWIHIGTGSQKSEIETYAAEKLKGKEYNFLGHIDNSEILRTYERYDVDFFINTSDSEGVPVSIMEAISMGIPVIARNVGGNSEIVEANTGYLINNIDNMKNVYNQVNTIIKQRLDNNLDKYSIRSQRSISLWKLQYDADKNYDLFFSKMKE